MQRGSLRAEFQHVPQNCDATAEVADRRLSEQRDSGRHGGRVGIVALVEQQCAAARQPQCDARAAARRRLQIVERERRQRQVGADQRGYGQHGDRIEQQVAPRRAKLISDRLTEDDGLCRRRLRLQRIAKQERISVVMFAEANYAFHTGRLAAAASRAYCALSRLITAAPPGSIPTKISALASAIPSRAPKYSR